MDKKYYISLDDSTDVPVSEDIYRAYYRPVWREAKRRKVRADNEYSFEFMVEKYIDGNIMPMHRLTDEIVEDKLLLESLMEALDNLTIDELGIINAVYFEEKTECEIAHENRVSQQYINKKKAKILCKLHKLIKI